MVWGGLGGMVSSEAVVMSFWGMAARPASPAAERGRTGRAKRALDLYH